MFGVLLKEFTKEPDLLFQILFGLIRVILLSCVFFCVCVLRGPALVTAVLCTSAMYALSARKLRSVDMKWARVVYSKVVQRYSPCSQSCITACSPVYWDTADF